MKGFYQNIEKHFLAHEKVYRMQGVALGRESSHLIRVDFAGTVVQAPSGRLQKGIKLTAFSPILSLWHDGLLGRNKVRARLTHR